MRTSATIGDAWAEFYLANRRTLGAYARVLTGSAAEAEDLVQDVLVRLVRRGCLVDSGLGYVLRCLRNQVIDRRRVVGVRPATVTLEADKPALPDGAPIEDCELSDAVRSALRQLPGERREVIVLKVYGDMPFREIAEVVGRPLGTVTSQYARGLDELRGLLQREPYNV